MKRFHVHVGVEDLEQSIRFYSSLFAAAPTVRKPDYAKWLLDDPRVNFAISQQPGAGGIHHLGLQTEDAGELSEIHGRLATAGAAVFDEGQVTCCYAKSDKAWVHDPQGIAWETFRTLGESTVYGGCGPTAPVHAPDPAEGRSAQSPSVACCGPAAPGKSEVRVASPQAVAPCCGPAA